EQAAKAQTWKLPVCYDDDDDEEGYNSFNDNIISKLPPYSAVTPSEPIDSLNMGDEHLNTIPTTESDEFIKSCVENLVPNPSESEGENGCDSFSDEDFLKKIYLNPLFDEEIIPMEKDKHSFNVESDLIRSMPNHDSSITISSKIDSLFDEFADIVVDNSSLRLPEEIVSDNSNAGIESFSLSPILNLDSNSHMEEINLPFTPDDSMPPGIEKDEMTLKGISRSLKNCLTIIPFPFLPMSHTILIFPHLIVLLQNHQMKSPDLLSHQGVEAFQPSAECPMIINGKNTPGLDVPLFHFYPP
nr:hypothetical protein [Tanacetum cinerariifolium]